MKTSLVLLLSMIFLNSCKKNSIDETIPEPTAPVPVQETAYAFPGAEGFGRDATGGRGGKVYVVTKLSDDGSAGTFRHAVNQAGKRYILFAVSGNIELQSNITLSNGDVTIAGQTAPGDGICLKNYSFIINADNVIIRYMRFRMGDTGAQQGDAMEGRYRKNIIIDHCSMSWSTDECASFYGNENFTLQWSILSESLRNSIHEKGIHGYGGIWGGKHASFHHNLLAHHDNRNPRFDHPGVYSSPQVAAAMRGTVDFRNNVIYNWGTDASYGGEAGSFNLVNNYYKPGPASMNKRRFLNAYKQATSAAPVYGYGSFYIDGNFMAGHPDITADNWLGVEAKSGSAADKNAIRLAAPLPFGVFISKHSASEAYAAVLEFAGASLKRDATDTRIINETRNGTFSAPGSRGSMNGLIDSQNDAGGWPQLIQAAPPTDTDADGIPDEWERSNKLDPNKANANGRNLSTGYDDLEVYINSLVKIITDNQLK